MEVGAHVWPARVGVSVGALVVGAFVVGAFVVGAFVGAIGFLYTQLLDDLLYAMPVLHILYGARPSHLLSYTPEQVWLRVHAASAAAREA